MGIFVHFNQRGFTLIELMIVLALAGLLSLYVGNAWVLGAQTNQLAMATADFNEAVSLLTDALQSNPGCTTALQNVNNTQYYPNYFVTGDTMNLHTIFDQAGNPLISDSAQYGGISINSILLVPPAIATYGGPNGSTLYLINVQINGSRPNTASGGVAFGGAGNFSKTLLAAVWIKSDGTFIGCN